MKESSRSEDLQSQQHLADRQERGPAAPVTDLTLTSLPVGLHGRGGAQWSASKITHLFGQEVGSSCCLESQMDVWVEVSSLHSAGWASVQHDKWEQEPASGTWVETTNFIKIPTCPISYILLPSESLQPALIRRGEKPPSWLQGQFLWESHANTCCLRTEILAGIACSLQGEKFLIPWENELTWSLPRGRREDRGLSLLTHACLFSWILWAHSIVSVLSSLCSLSLTYLDTGFPRLVF